ncbi:hypothetical protein FSP39_012050 [Pinctada imbricata]|uniref:B30.2/SPRY domain-containing protein n=1 Tax=Pinctada imbricata TaxID=66713 RepID=A0AA88YD51_PINIB|nr:hypothetical protein FSP39_012050 [Pinctada imbricata]
MQKSTCSGLPKETGGSGEVLKGQIDTRTYSILQRVFSDRSLQEEASALPTKNLELSTLHSFIEKSTAEVVTKSSPCSSKECSLLEDGRIGPPGVVLDQRSTVGTVATDPDYLGATGHSNFSTIRANCCVYRGRWIYEVMLWSKGVMQLGWSTIKCKFSHEEGVGDTKDSYSYDGSRLRKWNVKTRKYGEAWLAGDVISCAIDCDEGIISFYRNGKCMDEAFRGIKVGAGYAYFPTYPIDGYQLLQHVPREDVVRSQVLLGCIERLLPVLIEQEEKSEEAGLMAQKEEEPPSLGDCRSEKATSLLIAAHLFENLAPILKSAYVVECCLVPLLLKFCNTSTDLHIPLPHITFFLDLAWSLMQEHEIKPCMENLITTLLYSFYKTAPDTSNFSPLCTFDKIKFPVFMHVKPPDDAGLATLMPEVFWATLDNDPDITLPAMTDKDHQKKKVFLDACDRLRAKVEELEDLQIEILKLLLINSDIIEGKTSRLIFCEKFRTYLKNNVRLGRITQVTTCPLSFLHRLVRAVQFYWDDFQKEDPDRFVFSSEAYLPIHEFWSDTYDSMDLQRCGGLVSHLNRMLGSEVNKAQGFQLTKEGSVFKVQSPQKPSDYPALEMPSGNSLMTLLDMVLLLYHLSSHTQLSKMCSIRDSLKEFVTGLHDTEAKLKICPADNSDIREELAHARDVLNIKYEDLARQIGWLIAVVYSQRKQEDVAWILRVTMRTVEKASTFHLLFQYLPEFYIENVINTSVALRTFFHPINDISSLRGYDKLKEKFAMFLTKHFADGRIVNTDLRDNIVQALACYICYPTSLKALEQLPNQNKRGMIQSLIEPYENRSWAQTNWILVRIWKGCGYGFRYTHLPHLVPLKIQPTEFGFAYLQKPCPSKVFQDVLREVLLSNHEAATRFLDTLITQLNWSFSEFVGMMQEVQQRVSRTDTIRILESRQLKICATCFEIAVNLMRVLEMVVTIAPELYSDASKDMADILLARLVQLLCQVLNRVTSHSGVFSSVVGQFIQGLESVSHYPILAVTTGILIQLVIKTDKNR